MVLREGKKLLLAMVFCFCLVIAAAPLSAAAAQSIMVPDKNNASAPLREVRHNVTERSVEITLVTDGLKEEYVMEGGFSHAFWQVDFSDDKHNYEVYCHTPNNEVGSFTMDDMNYTILIDCGDGTWRGVSCSHSINGNEITWTATLNATTFVDPIDVDSLQIKSYYIHEYHDPGAVAKINWKLDDDGKLTIRDGQDGMPLTALYEQKDKVKSIDVDVTLFSATADYFAGFENLETATLKAKKIYGTALTGLFKNCTKLRTADLSRFNTEGIMRMDNMFQNCTSLESVNLSGLDTKKVTTMNYMFDGCSSLKSLDLSSFQTPQLIGMSLMFKGCSSLTSLDVSMLDTSKVQYMDNAFMCSRYSYDDEDNEIVISNLKTLKLGDMSTASVISASNMFGGCCELTSLDVSKFDTSKMKNMGNMFQECRSLVSLDVSHFDTSSATSMISMFYGCSSLESLDVSHFNTSNVTTAAFMFYGCNSLKSLDLSNFDLSAAKNVNWFLALPAGTLQTIRTPKNLTLNCALPTGSGTWQVESTGEEVLSLPKDSETSVTLVWTKKIKDPNYVIATKSLTLYDTISIDFKVKKTVIEGNYHDPYLLAEQDGEMSKITSPKEDGEYLIFTYRVAPHMMNESVRVIPRALDASGRDVMGEAFTYSVTDYCYNMLNKETYQTEEWAPFRRLLVDMLRYGDAAQTYKNNVGVLAGQFLSEEQLAMGTDVTIPMNYNNVKDVNFDTVADSDRKATIVTAALYLEAAVNIQFKFTAEDLTGLKVVISDENGVLAELTPNPLWIDANGRYYVTFGGLNAGQMRKTVYATVMQGSKAVSNTMCYSIESYAASQSNSTVENLPELLHAMMRYGDSAKAFVGAK
ncbi:MAG: BspA family leucine-rich repeat surface protein [Lachnospiraceae bacterium]|nr:BspA family leucine-rich repeat surface protein [Lachnospiraceae bacterium]